MQVRFFDITLIILYAFLLLSRKSIISLLQNEEIPETQENVNASLKTEFQLLKYHNLKRN